MNLDENLKTLNYLKQTVDRSHVILLAKQDISKSVTEVCNFCNTSKRQLALEFVTETQTTYFHHYILSVLNLKYLKPDLLQEILKFSYSKFYNTHSSTSFSSIS